MFTYSFSPLKQLGRINADLNWSDFLWYEIQFRVTVELPKAVLNNNDILFYIARGRDTWGTKSG